jgi:hypothetical protein
MNKNFQEGFEHESKRIIPNRESKIKMGKMGYKRCHTEGRNTRGRN